MKHLALKRVSAVAVTVVLLLTTVFSLSVFANAATFTPRLSAPASTNKYYYNSDYNVFQKYGYGLPNCTAYAYGRAYEILGKEPKLSWNGAGQWYGYNQANNYYSYGSTPKVGAIACWSYSGGGHVAVVEKIDSDGSMTLSNSEWGGRTFYLTYANASDSNPGGNSWWNFQGYIYLLNSDPVITDNENNNSDYKTGIYKTTAEPYLNMRSSAGLSYNVVQPVYKNTTLTVTQTSYADGYNWGKTTLNGKTGWVALEFCTYVSEVPQPTTSAPATTAAPTTEAPTTEAPTTEAPTTEAPTTEQTTTEQLPTIPYSQSIGIGKGDVDQDGRISILDATMVQRYLVKLGTLTEEQKVFADFSGDGRISIEDVTTIQRYLSASA